MTEVAASTGMTQGQFLPTPQRTIAHGTTRARMRPLILLGDLTTAFATGGIGWMLGVLDAVSAPVAILGWPLAVALLGGYEPQTVGELRRDRTARVVRAAALFAFGCWAATALGAPSLAALPLVLTLGLLAGSSVLLRVLASTLPSEAPRIVLVGHEAAVAGIGAELARVPGSGEVVGAHLVGDDVLDITEVLRLVRECDAESVVAVPGRELPAPVLRRLQWALARQGVDLSVTNGLTDVSASRLSHLSVAGLGLTLVRPAPASGAARLAKDVLERLAAALLLLVIAPLLVAITVAVRHDSAGPAFFRQTRVGRGGRTFTMYKFRSMSTDAEVVRAALDSDDADNVLFKMRHDPRITRVGAVLRRYSLDELPQLFNVVLGHMSLVGPRPALPEEVARYDDDPRERLRVKPGLTGLWQVSGRSDLSWEESVRLDLLYVDNWSPSLDLSILARTFGAVFGHRGAY